MNITSIKNLNTAPLYYSQTKNNQPYYGLKMSNPLVHDTVSFGSKMRYLLAPVVKEPVASSEKYIKKYNGVSALVAKKLHTEKKYFQEQIEAVFRTIFANLISTKEEPFNYIEKLVGRTKSKDSIILKSMSVEAHSEEEAREKITDFNGVKAVIQIDYKKAINGIFKDLKNAVKNGQIRIKEIDCKIPKFAEKLHEKELEKYAYATEDQINDLAQANFKKYNKRTLVNPRNGQNSNYTALHIAIEVPVKNPKGNIEWILVELQIMDHDVSVYKKLVDDIVFKILDRKPIKKYKPVIDLLKPVILPKELLKMSDKEIAELTVQDLANMNMKITEEELKGLPKRIKMRKEFDAYRARVFAKQREKKPLAPEFIKENGKEFFEPLSSSILPREFDVNNIYDIVLKCNAQSKKAAKKKKIN